MSERQLLISIRERMEKVVAQNDLIIRQNTTIHQDIHKLLRESGYIIKLLLPKPKFQVTLSFNNQISITDMKTATVTMGHAPFDLMAVPINSENEVAEVEAGTEGATSSNPDVLTIEEDPNNQTRYVVTLVGEGESDVTISGDADLGEGVVDISTTIHFFVKPSPATGFQIGLPSDVVVGEQ